MKHPRIPRCSLFLCIFSLACLSIFQASDAFSSARQMISKNGFGGVVTPDIRQQDPSKKYGNLFVKDAKNTVEGQQVYSTPRLLQIFSARLILEVFGSAGAVWGFSDVCKLRNHATNELWRQYAVTVGVIFFIRYCLQINDYLKLLKNENGVASKTNYWVRFFQIFSAKLVLEVFGGAGAVWGFSEVVTLRNSATQELWRCNSLAMGCIMFVRFLMQMKEYSVNHATRMR